MGIVDRRGDRRGASRFAAIRGGGDMSTEPTTSSGSLAEHLGKTAADTIKTDLEDAPWDKCEIAPIKGALVYLVDSEYR